jgi:two-component system, sensor histidine kinase and response regulator
MTSNQNDTPTHTHPSDESCSSKPCRVLVADDHPPGLILATEAMRQFQCEVVGVDDGTAAVAAHRQRPFDLIFLDVHMPSLGGIQATHEIRRWERETAHQRTPIVALTASAMAHEQRACLAEGMDDVLVKPFRLQALHELVRKWCP